jgi:anti-sigma B factor antagonist
MASGPAPSSEPSRVVPVEGERGGLWAVRPHGEIDSEHAGLLAAQFDSLIEQGAKVIVVDLQHASFLDSSGLRVIVRAGEQLRELGGQLLLEGASGAVARILEVTGLLEHYAEMATHRLSEAPVRSAE